MLARAARCLAALALLAAASGALASESSISCDGGRVGIGDTKVDLLGKCGEPSLRDARAATTAAVVVSGDPTTVTGGSVSATVEQWSYNFGSNRFVMVVTLEQGRVILIERGGYGYDNPARLEAPRAAPAVCDSAMLHPGDFKVDVLARCGEPTTRDARREQRPAPAPAPSGGTATRFYTVEVEVWTYDLGPQRFIVFVTLENGKVVAVDHGGYGYAR